MATYPTAALITGSGTRVGAFVAKHLAAQGCDIALHYRNSKEAAEETADVIRSAGRKAVLLQGDLTDPVRTSALMSEARSTLGEINCLINNASIFEKDGLYNFTHENFVTHFSVHAEAPLILIRDFAAQLGKDSKGSIFNLTDGMTGWSMSDNFLSYSLSKMALANITQLLARNLAPRIRINTIAPGPTIPGAQDKPETFSKLKKILPLALVSNPQEICDAIDYLFKAESVTGQTIQLNGGIQTLLSMHE